jgi:hypothetical protein
MKQYYSRPFLTKEECKYLIDYHDAQQPERIATEYKTKTGRILDRKQNILSLVDTEEPYKFFANKLKDAHQDICDNLRLNDRALFSFQQNWFKKHPDLKHESLKFENFENKIKTNEVVLSKYGLGHYCAPHVDNNRIGLMFIEKYWQSHEVPKTLWHRHPRLYTVSVMLNDEFEGGRLRIENSTTADYIDVSAPAGYLVAMDARCRHEVTQVTAGARYALISWAYLEHEGFYPEGAIKNIFELDPIR